MPHRKSPETEALIEGDGPVVYGVDDDCEHREGATGAQDASYRVREKKLSDSLPPRFLVASKSADKRGRDGFVPRQLSGNLARQVVEGQGERTEAVEPNYTTLVVDCDEHACDISLVILSCPPSKPVVQSGLAAGERRSVVLRAERLDDDPQFRLSKKLTVALEGRHKLFCRRWWIRDSIEKCVAILAREDHTFMLVEHSSRAFVGEVSGCQASNRHGVPDELLRRTGDPQLDALSLELTIDR